MTSKTNSATLAKIKTQKVYTASNRPGSGRVLFAHTLAALALLGFWKTKTTDRKARTPGAVQTLIGPRALRYHTRQGNFARDDAQRVILTDQGLAMFAGRAGALGFPQRTDQIAESKIIKEMIAAMRKGGTVDGIKFDKERNIPA